MTVTKGRGEASISCIMLTFPAGHALYPSIPLLQLGERNAIQAAFDLTRTIIWRSLPASSVRLVVIPEPSTLFLSVLVVLLRRRCPDIASRSTSTGDSDADGVDASAAGVLVTVELRNANGNLVGTYTATTDSNGIAIPLKLSTWPTPRFTGITCRTQRFTTST